MINTLLIILSLTLTLSAAASSTPAPLPDLGFEVVRNNVPALWRENSGAGAGFESFSAVSGPPPMVRSGGYAVRLVQRGTREDGGKKAGHLYTKPSLPVETGARYELTFWARGEGNVRALLYTYTRVGDEEASLATVPLSKASGDSPDNAYTLRDGEPWTECGYLVSPEQVGPEVSSIRIAIAAHGTVYADDCSFTLLSAPAPREEAVADAGAAPKASEENPASPEDPGADGKPQPGVNLATAGVVARAPTIDGTMASDEYPTLFTGLIDNNANTAYPFANHIGLGYDRDHLYFAISLQLPPDYALKARGQARDDPALLADKDIFYLFLRPDDDVAQKGFEGIYLAISSAGVVYDAWEKINWAEGRCDRDPSFHAGWQTATGGEDGFWTLECSVPREDLGFALVEGDASYALSFGMNLGTGRLAWQTHPNWFDHNQAFGRLRLSGSGPSVSVPSLGSIHRGELEPAFHLTRTGSRAHPFRVSYRVSTPRTVPGGIGKYIFDVAMDRTAEDVLAADTVFAWQESGELPPGTSRQAGEGSRLTAPADYVLEVEAAADGEAVFTQKIPFRYSAPVRTALTPVPAREIVEARIRFYGAREDEMGKVRISFQGPDGKGVTREERDVTGPEMNVSLPMASLAPGDYVVQVDLFGRNGAFVASHREPFTKWAEPEWLRDRKGLEALEPDWVPDPWIPVAVEGNRVETWGRSFVFEEGKLLADVVSQDISLLSSGVTLHYTAGGKSHTVEMSAPRFDELGRGRTDVIQQGQAEAFSLEVRQRIEFDGMDRFDLALVPDAALRVDRLWIEIPFAVADYMLYYRQDGLYSASWQAGLARDLDEPGFYSWIWLGDDHVGCTFFTENYKGWALNSAKPRITLTREEGSSALRLLLVNEPAEIASPMQVTFGLHPTPVKPFYPGWREFRSHGLGIKPPPVTHNIASPDYWKTHYSSPTARNWEALNGMVAHVHKSGQKALPYIGMLYLSPYGYVRPDFGFLTTDRFPDGVISWKKAGAPRLEEYFYYKRDWDLVPPIVHNSSRETRMEARLTPSSSYADYFAHGISEILTRSDLDGFFFDIDNPMLNRDPEKGLVYRTRDGNEEGTYELFALRDMYKRVYYLFDVHRGAQRKPYIIGHGFGAAAPYMSFWDATLNGEEIKPETKFGFTRMVLQRRLKGAPVAIPAKDGGERSYDAFTYRCIYGKQFGMPQVFLPQYGYIPELKLNEHSRETLSINFLHNSLLQVAYIPAQPVFDFWNKVEVPFGMGDTVFHPYWDNGVRAEPPCVRVSYWKKETTEDYLVAVANWSGEPVTAQVVLPPPLDNFPAGRDMESGERLDTAGDFEAALPPHDLRVFRFPDSP